MSVEKGGQVRRLEAASSAAPLRSSKARLAALAAAAVLLAAVAAAGLRFGSVPVTAADAFDALFRYSPESYEQTVVRFLRLPRTVIGLGAGAALAVAGAALQATTRNPLADPSILGVNAGAAFGVVVAVYFGQLAHPLQYVWFAFAGGLGAAAAVYAIGSTGPGGGTPVKLALAGVVVASLLNSWLTAILLYSQETLDVVRFWLAGSLAGRDLSVFYAVLPFMAVGMIGMLLGAEQLNVLSMSEETARALGMHTGRARLIVGGLSVLMVGGAVAAAGPIGFVGLAVPHIVRGLVGPDYRWVLPFCVIVGPLMLLSADIAGRVIARPSEVPVGIVTALVGAPFLIALARRRQVAGV
ncbi:MAG: iron ABC transporter permease [Limnochordia bacterium]